MSDAMLPSPTLRRLMKEGRSQDLMNLLQTLIVREWLRPSQSMWLVSPWLSDTGIMNNEALAFAHLEPRWPRGWVGLVDVLATSVRRGTEVHIVTRPLRTGLRMDEPDRQTADFLQSLLRATRDHQKHLHVHHDDESRLHGKGWLTDGWYLGGSMNFTHAGVTLWTEFLHVSTDAGLLAGTLAEFERTWGSA